MARNELYMDIVQEYNQNIEALFNRISSLIDSAREYVSKTVNTVEVATKYAIGQYIVENEQEGKERAKYGKAILKNLSERLTERYGDGWSVETLTLCRKFYSTYSKIVNSDYEIQKSISAKEWLDAVTKVSSASKRSTCTLNTLISINRVLLKPSGLEEPA